MKTTFIRLPETDELIGYLEPHGIKWVAVTYLSEKRKVFETEREALVWVCVEHGKAVAS